MGNLTVVREDHEKYGLYLWQMPDGSFVADDAGNFLNIPSTYGDPSKINNITGVVNQFGIFEGEPVFFGGRRRVTDDEFEDQKARMLDGLVPDTEDIGSILDDMRANGGK